MVTKKKTTRKTTRKKTRRKVAGKAAKKKKIPGWILLLSGMVMGLLFAIYGYVNGWVPKANISQKPVAQSQLTQNKNTIDDNSADLQIKPKKNYDFYETLQEMEVIVDQSELQQTTDRVAKSYVLQLGAFKKLEDAESLKAQVAFTGMASNIQTINIDGTQWHRVRVGPFQSGRKADVNKRKLEQNGFSAIIIQQK